MGGRSASKSKCSVRFSRRWRGWPFSESGSWRRELVMVGGLSYWRRELSLERSSTWRLEGWAGSREMSKDFWVAFLNSKLT